MVTLINRLKGHYMKLATRINSFKDKAYYQKKSPRNKTLYLLNKIVNLPGLKYVDLNYPEHFDGVSVKEIEKLLSTHHIQVNGVAIRYYSFDQFSHGAFTNPDLTIQKKAIKETQTAINLSKQLGAKYITIWPSQDGFEIPFQVNYAQLWDNSMRAIKKIATNNPDMLISIEYKPAEPRANLLFYSGAITLEFINELNLNNVGITIDYAHSLASGEKTNLITELILKKNKLFGVHLNDGYGKKDDGLPIGSVNLVQTLEFLYLLDKYRYQGVIYFDTDPDFTDPKQEYCINQKMIAKMLQKISQLDKKIIAKIQKQQSSLDAIKLIQSLLL